MGRAGSEEGGWVYGVKGCDKGGKQSKIDREYGGGVWGERWRCME